MNKILLGLLVGLFTVSAIACPSQDGDKTKGKPKGDPTERSQTL